MYQDSVMIPVGKWAGSRLKNLSSKDKEGRRNSSTKSGFGVDLTKVVDRDMVYPSNVLHMPSETGNKNHPAAFPEVLPRFFIKLFTKPGDLVVDPFCGSGTTGVAADSLKRDYLGIDTNEDYLRGADYRISPFNRPIDVPPPPRKLRGT